MKKLAVIASLSAVLVSTIALAEIHHPNLRDAHHEAENAIHHIQAAQADNKGVEFGGHAEKAMELLKQAQIEMVEADKWNDAHHH